MLRQILISVGLLIVAAALCVLFIPGTVPFLAGYGIALPVSAATQSAAPASGSNGQPAPGGAQGGGQGAQGQAAAPGGGQGGGRGGFGGRSRQSSVVTSDVVIAKINDTLSAIGQGNAIKSVSIVAPAGGQLLELLASPGQTVTQGQVIGRLDASAEQVAFDKAKLALADAQSTLTRNQGLASSALVASSALATIQLAADNAQLELQGAELDLQKRTIVSPIAGTVGLMQVKPGNFVAANAAVTTVEDASSILIDFWVPERYAATLTVGMPVKATAAALPGRSFEGTINAVDNRIDPASRTLQVQAMIPNADGAVRPGMSFTIGLTFAGEEFPAVNPLAIQWSSEGSFVWTVVDGKAKKVMAEIVQRNTDGVLLKGDLKPGDAVISEGVLQLTDGAAVTILDGPGKPAADASATPAVGTPAQGQGQGGQHKRPDDAAPANATKS